MTQPPSSVPPPIKRRPKRRNRVLLRGIISFANGAHSFNCSIRDITDTGACVGLSATKMSRPRLDPINIRDSLVYRRACAIWNSGLRDRCRVQKNHSNRRNCRSGTKLFLDTFGFPRRPTSEAAVKEFLGEIQLGSVPILDFEM